jgi:hypothetical protein
MAYLTAMAKHFIGYIRQDYKVAVLTGDPTGQSHFFCRRIQDDAASRANGTDMRLKQWASRTPPVEAIQVNFTDTPAQDAAIDAKLAAGQRSPASPTAQPSPSNGSNSKECAYHATCTTSPATAPTAPPH